MADRGDETAFAVGVLEDIEREILAAPPTNRAAVSFTYQRGTGAEIIRHPS